MARVEPDAVRRWVEGMREAEKVSSRLEAERLRRLSVFQGVQEYCRLREEARRQEMRDGGEIWHRKAAARYGRLLEAFRKAARRIPVR